MRNLKKLLALTLVLAMMMGLGMSALASFPDVKTTDDYATAINLCTSLGIVAGYDDGSFKSEGDVTREQFAKFVYVLMNGKDDGAALYKGVSPYGDVAAERWSAGYIQWAKSRNIIVGRDPEGKVFDPEAKVTFAEASKMYVVALGYDAKNFTFPYGFIDKAQSLGLFADVKGYSVNAPANRGQVAQMTYNGLYADAPYFGSYQAAVGTGSSATTTKLYTPLEKAFEIKEHPVTTVLDATSNYALDSAFTKAGQVKLFAEAKVIGGTNHPMVFADFAYTGNVDSLVGSAVRVFYKDVKGTASGFDSGDLIIDIQEGKANKQYTFKPGDVKTSSPTKTDDSKLYVAIDGTTRNLNWMINSDSILRTDVVTSLGVNKNGSPVGDAKNVTASYFSNSNGNTYKAIDQDGDNFIDVVIIMESATAKVASADTARVTISAIAPQTAADTNGVGFVGAKDIKATDATIIKVADGVAKDSWVTISAVKSFTSNNKVETIYSIAPTTVLKNATYNKTEGTGTSGTKYYFDGTAKTVAAAGYTLGNPAFSATTDVGNKYDLVFDANGYIVKRDVVTSLTSDSWLYIKNAENFTDGDNKTITSSVNVLLPDGTSKNIRVSSDLKTAFGDVALAPAGSRDLSTKIGSAYSYALNTAGEIIELRDMAHVAARISGFGGGVQSTVAAGTATYNKDSMVFGGGVSGYAVANTVVFFENKADSKSGSLKGSDLNSFTANYAVDSGIRRDDGSFAVIVLKSATGYDVPTKTANKVGLVLNVVKEQVDSKFVYTFKVAYDGKIEEVKSDPKSSSVGAWDSLLTGNKTYGFHTLKFNAAGQLTGTDPATRYSLGTTPATAGTTSSVLVDRVLAGALSGYNVGGQTYTYTDAASTKYKLDADGTAFTPAFGETVNYYLINSTPVTGGTAPTSTIPTTAQGGFFAKTATISVADKSILQESASVANGGLSYVVDVTFNADGKINGVYYYSTPVYRYMPTKAVVPPALDGFASVSGSTITLTANGTLKAGLTVPAGTTLELGSYTLTTTADYDIVNNGTINNPGAIVIVGDSALTNNGTITMTSGSIALNSQWAIVNNGTMTVNSLATGTSSGIKVTNGSVTTINAVTGANLLTVWATGAMTTTPVVTITGATAPVDVSGDGAMTVTVAGTGKVTNSNPTADVKDDGVAVPPVTGDAIPAGKYIVSASDTVAVGEIYLDTFGRLAIDGKVVDTEKFAAEIKALVGAVTAGDTITINANGEISAMSIIQTKAISIGGVAFAPSIEELTIGGTFGVTLVGDVKVKNLAVVDSFTATGNLTVGGIVVVKAAKTLTVTGKLTVAAPTTIKSGLNGTLGGVRPLGLVLNDTLTLDTAMLDMTTSSATVAATAGKTIVANAASDIKVGSFTASTTYTPAAGSTTTYTLAADGRITKTQFSGDVIVLLDLNTTGNMKLLSDGVISVTAAKTLKVHGNAVTDKANTYKLLDDAKLETNVNATVDLTSATASKNPTVKTLTAGAVVKYVLKPTVYEFTNVTVANAALGTANTSSSGLKYTFACDSSNTGTSVASNSTATETSTKNDIITVTTVQADTTVTITVATGDKT